METKIDAGLMKQPEMEWKRVGIFLGFAYGIAWLTALVIYLTGGIVNSPQLVGGMSLAFVLMAVVYMGAPALAHIFTRLVTHEGWSNMNLRPNFRKGWRYWLMAWLLPPLFILIGAAIFFVIFPQHFDATLATLQGMIALSPTPLPFTALGLLLVQLGAGILVSPIVNSLFTFGEEFGWRAYLQPKLMVLGPRKAMLLMGVIWGVWHWPVIFMGYEYGFEYWGAPVVGPLLFCYITFGLGIILGWAAWRAKSVWPAVIGHAMINGVAAISALITLGKPNPLLGPMPIGLIGSLGVAIPALVLFFSTKAWQREE